MAKKKNKPQQQTRDNSVTRKKKVIVNTEPTKKKVQPTVSKVAPKRQAATAVKPEDFIYNKTHYMLMGLGFALVVAGLLLMSGGEQAPDQWNEDEIYSFRRIVLAPIVILIGLGINLFSIFKK